MKKLLFVLALFALASSSYGQRKLTKEVRDPVTFEITEDWKIAPELLMQREGFAKPDGIVIDVNGVRYVFSQATWDQYGVQISAAIQNIINTAKALPVNRQKRRDAAEAYRAKKKAEELAKRQAAQEEADRLDGLSGEQLP